MLSSLKFIRVRVNFFHGLQAKHIPHQQIVPASLLNRRLLLAIRPEPDLSVDYLHFIQFLPGLREARPHGA